MVGDFIRISILILALALFVSVSAATHIENSANGVVQASVCKSTLQSLFPNATIEMGYEDEYIFDPPAFSLYNRLLAAQALYEAQCGNKKSWWNLLSPVAELESSRNNSGIYANCCAKNLKDLFKNQPVAIATDPEGWSYVLSFWECERCQKTFLAVDRQGYFYSGPAEYPISRNMTIIFI